MCLLGCSGEDYTKNRKNGRCTYFLEVTRRDTGQLVQEGERGRGRKIRKERIKERERTQKRENRQKEKRKETAWLICHT